MSVNKIKLKINNNDKYLKIPLDLTHNNKLNQSDLINNEFVKIEEEKAINDIQDYETKRFSPIQDGVEISQINYSVNLKVDDSIKTPTMLSDIDFTNEDLLYKRNSFKYSFLSIIFYNTDNLPRQAPISFNRIHQRISRFDMLNGPEFNSDNNSIIGRGGRNRDDRTNTNNNVSERGDGNPNSIGRGGSSRTSSGSTRENTSSRESTTLSTSYNSRGGSRNETVEENDLSGLENLFVTELGEDVIVGTENNNISENNLFYETCNNIVYAQRNLYYFDKLNWKVVTRAASNFEDGINKTCEDYPTNIVGEPITNVADLGIPKGLFDTIYLIDDNYTYNNKTYSVYSKFSSNLLFGNKSFNGIYFIPNESEDSIDNTPVNNYDNYGSVKDVSQIPLRFIVEDAILYPNGFSESFYLYNTDDLPKSIYMRASYNSAKTGKSYDLITVNHNNSVNDIIKYLHVKFDLKLIDDKYYYEVDTDYSPNITIDGDRMTIKLYQIQGY